MSAVEHPTTQTRISELRRHPRNYRAHPADQIEHLKASILEHGFYRNIVVARGVILAGHGVVQAATALQYEFVPVIELDIDPDSPKALKILAGDNELGKLADIDDRKLSELLREVNDNDDLLGTGYDDAMLANLVFVTRNADEIRTQDAAAEWAGMPEYEGSAVAHKVIISFDSAQERDRFVSETPNMTMRRKNPESMVWAAVWPAAPRDDIKNVRVSGE